MYIFQTVIIMAVQLDRIPDSLGYLVLTEDGAVVNVSIRNSVLQGREILVYKGDSGIQGREILVYKGGRFW